MNGSNLPVNGRSGQDQVLRWLGDNAETWSESFTFAEDTDQEDTITWLKRNGLVIEEEDWTDWAKGVGGGALAGAGTGAAAGPYGALAGLLVGAGLGALQTYQQQQQQQQKQPAPPPQQQPSPPPSQRPSPAPATPTPAPPQTGGGTARDSAQSPQALQQLVQLLPLLTQLLAQQQSKQKVAGEASGDDVEGGESGDYIPDEAFDSASTNWLSQFPDFADRGIENPIPRESRLQESESVPAPEYPLATRFVPAAATNYKVPLTGAPSYQRPVQRIVIHITDGGSNINGTIAWFANPRAGVSAHYIVGQDGEVVQMVQHNNIAFHAHSANSDSIGIEHVARAPGTFSRTDRGLSPTEGQYCSSAALVRWLCERYSIPMDRVHILGHSEADPSTTHTDCPNAVWDWSYYMSLVTSGRCSPRPSLP